MTFAAITVALILGSVVDRLKFSSWILFSILWLSLIYSPIALGAALLWFGWFGFNAGSELAIDGITASAFLVTNTSAAMGALDCFI